MSDLTEFLLARIAEDEAAWSEGTSLMTRPDFSKLSRHMLVECEVKRRLIERSRRILEAFADPEHGYWPDVNRRERHHANDTLYDLAMAYADHPDYDEAWRP